MHEPNREKLLDLLRQHPEWKVLDVGAGEQPLLRADVSIDIMEFSECGDQGCIGDLDDWELKRLGANSWVQMDICGGGWSQFKDLEFDFVVCSNVLEDVRDPIRVVSEINRVGRAGYYEFPSVGQEASTGVDESNPDGLGYWHHRWYIQNTKKGLEFLPKLPVLKSACRAPEIEFESVYWESSIAAIELMASSPDDYIDYFREMIA